MTKSKRVRPIRLTSHPTKSSKPIPIRWGAADPAERGPVIATLTEPAHRNVIGTHSGAYSVYRALAIASGALQPEHRPDLTDTSPTDRIGPHRQWSSGRIVSIDPYGAIVGEVFADYLAKGYDIRPTIAITKAHIHLAELAEAVRAGRLEPDGRILVAGAPSGERGTPCAHPPSAAVIKAAIEPVWHLPGVAARFEIGEDELRRTLFEHTAGMFPELVTRTDLEVFLPPIGGMTVYIFGDLEAIGDGRPVTGRVHDECNGSDVFGSDICTCRPYLTHAIEQCIATAQAGGAGVIVYFRKEGRALGEVTKFLVYNARKRQKGGDRADAYFARTECVAGTQDVRFQDLMPDVLHWLGISRIDRFVSMSNMKYDSIVRSGIEIGERVSIPEEMIPADARVEIDAKIAAGYFTAGAVPDARELAKPKGRGLD